MTTAPTLIDLVYRETFKRHSVLGAPMREQLQRARKFVLDESMSGFMGDLGWEAYRKHPERMAQYIDELRISARLPHAATWIEWDEKALVKSANKYGSTMNPETCPKRSGWLMLQHPQLDTGFVGFSFGQGATMRDGQFTPQDDEKIGFVPFGVAWSVTDAPPPWAPLEQAEELSKLRGMSLAGMMTGIVDYNGPVTVIGPRPYIALPDNYFKNVTFRQMMHEQFGMLRYVMAVLATINDVPVRETKIRQSKGFFARSRYRKFLDHSVISLTVPQDRYRALARKVVAAARRRAHQVRGHWRMDWRFPGARDCSHQWTQQPEKTWQRCSLCGAHRMWIHEHQRGDASLGLVTHDYEVTHAN